MADWLNRNLYEYIDKKEKIIIDVRKNEKICRLASIFGGIFFGLFLTAFISFFKIILTGIITDTDPNFYNNLPFVIVLGVFLTWFFIWLIYKSELATRYVLTNSGIYEISGLIFKSFKFVAYNQVTDVDMSRGIFEQMFGCGSVGVGTASGNISGTISEGNGTISSENELDINSVNEYKEIRQLIIKHRKK